MKNLINNRIIILINTILINLAYGQDDIAITITNSNLGLIKETRILELEKGIHQFHLEDIPAQIEPTSVLVESEGSTFNVIEQNFEFDLISVDKILNKFLDKEIQIIQPDQNLVSGKLMSSSGSDLLLPSRHWFGWLKAIRVENINAGYPICQTAWTGMRIMWGD
jgi:hypothetical protein